MKLFFLAVCFCASIARSQEWIHYTTLNSPLPSDQVYALSFGPDNTLWIGTGGGLASLRNGVWSVYDTSNSPLPDANITSLAVDSAGTVWIGTASAGAVRRKDSVWTHFHPLNSSFPHTSVFDVTIGPGQEPWFATQNGTVALKEGQWKDLADKMIEPRSRSVAFDRRGTLWMGTYDPVDFRGYIEYMKGDSFSHTILSKLDLISTYARRMHSLNDSTMIVATGNGLAVVTNGVWKIHHKQDSPLPANGVSSLAVRGDTLIACTASGIAEIAGGNWNVIMPSSGGLPNDVVYAAAVDRSGHRWFGTGSSGVVVYRKGGIVASVETRTERPSEFVLHQNYPNPFNPSTTLRFTVHVSGLVTLKIYDALGREVSTLVNENLEAGMHHQRTFGASHLSSGIYFARLTSGSTSQVTKMMLVK